MDYPCVLHHHPRNVDSADRRGICLSGWYCPRIHDLARGSVMNAMQEAMVSAVSKDTTFPQFKGEVKPVVVHPRPTLSSPYAPMGMV